MFAFRLNDLLIRVDGGESPPSTIFIELPENCNVDVTDEESGDEGGTNLDHLPGSTLRSEILSDEQEDCEAQPKKKRMVGWML